MPDYGRAFSIYIEKRARWLLTETPPRRAIGGEKKMGAGKPQAPRPRSAGNQVGIPELYRQCLAAEQGSTKRQAQTDFCKTVLPMKVGLRSKVWQEVARVLV